MTKYQELYGETPNQFAADAYDCVYAYKMALEAAGCTPDMSNEELCDALIATFPTITLTGLTGDGAGITWDASGEVSKSPKGMVIENALTWAWTDRQSQRSQNTVPGGLPARPAASRQLLTQNKWMIAAGNGPPLPGRNRSSTERCVLWSSSTT